MESYILKRSRYTMKLELIDSRGEVESTVQIQSDAVVTISDATNMFLDFLRGCGYGIKDFERDEYARELLEGFVEQEQREKSGCGDCRCGSDPVSTTEEHLCPRCQNGAFECVCGLVSKSESMEEK